MKKLISRDLLITSILLGIACIGLDVLLQEQGTKTNGAIGIIGTIQAFATMLFYIGVGIYNKIKK